MTEQRSPATRKRRRARPPEKGSAVIDARPDEAGSEPEPDDTGSTWTPRVPRTVEQLGIGEDVLEDLILKTLQARGATTGFDLASALHVLYPIIDEPMEVLQSRKLVEVRRSDGHGRSGYVYELTSTGMQKATDALQSSGYVGPVPVSLDDFRESVRSQSVRTTHVAPARIEAALDDLVLPDNVMRALGPAVNSARSVFLYGRPGNGKTAVAERIAEMFGGRIYVPHAVQVDGQTMVLYDPTVHEIVDADDSEDRSWIRDLPEHDLRYLQVKRPTVFVGGELTLDELDLQYDSHSRTYRAPFQVKASGGVLVIDDFGRQRMPPENLLNRWIVPLEKGVDFLTLHNGVKFAVPFDSLLVFATNHDPSSLVDEAFLRRIHYKIGVGSPERDAYEEIFRDAAERRGVSYRPESVDYIYRNYYDEHDGELNPRACHPRDVLDHLVDIATYEKRPPELSERLLKEACDTYFLALTSTEGRVE